MRSMAQRDNSLLWMRKEAAGNLASQPLNGRDGERARGKRLFQSSPTLSATLVKDVKHQDQVLEFLQGTNNLRIDFNISHSIQLLGATVDIGPCSLVLNEAVVVD